MVETKREICSECGAITRWYYKRPTFCLCCKKEFTMAKKTQITVNGARKYIPLLDNILDKLTLDYDDIKIVVASTGNGTSFLFFSGDNIIHSESSPEILTTEEMNELMDLFYE